MFAGCGLASACVHQVLGLRMHLVFSEVAALRLLVCLPSFLSFDSKPHLLLPTSSVTPAQQRRPFTSLPTRAALIHFTARLQMIRLPEL